MQMDYHCPVCSARGQLIGSIEATWRFRLPCRHCGAELVFTWDGVLKVTRDAVPLALTEEPTVPIWLGESEMKIEAEA